MILCMHSVPQVNEETRALKRMVVTFLQQGVAQAVTVKDLYALQNGIIYFWNLHVHIFRHELYSRAIPELVGFLTSAVTAIDALVGAGATGGVQAPGAELFDHRLRLSLLETLAAYYESKNMLTEAIEAATKGTGAPAAAGGKPAKGAPVADTTQEVPEYLRKKVCEQASRLTLLQTAAGGAGGKGAAKGGDVPPVYGNSFLNVFSVIVQAEQSAPAMAKETAVALVNKAVEMLEKDVEADLSVMDFNSLSQVRAAVAAVHSILATV
jgi:hypothetical protein